MESTTEEIHNGTTPTRIHISFKPVDRQKKGPTESTAEEESNGTEPGGEPQKKPAREATLKKIHIQITNDPGEESLGEHKEPAIAIDPPAPKQQVETTHLNWQILHAETDTEPATHTSIYTQSVAIVTEPQVSPLTRDVESKREPEDETNPAVQYRPVSRGRKSEDLHRIVTRPAAKEETRTASNTFTENPHTLITKNI